MNTIKNLLLSATLLSLAGCAGEEFIPDVAGDGSVTFSIRTDGSDVAVVSRAGSEENNNVISDMHWYVADTDGNILRHHYGRLDNQFTKLTLEGLKYGDYNLVIAATLAGDDKAFFAEPATFGDPWLVSGAEKRPIDALYCYKKQPFSVGKEGTAMDVVLEHSVARVYVDLKMDNISQMRHIKHVAVTFNDKIPAALDAGGTYSGEATVEGYDIYDPSGVFTFTTFPADKPVSGYVEIESSRDGGDNFLQRYEFDNLTLEAGKIARINLEYRHPEQESGLLYIAADELWRFEPSTMFMADEPREVFYNNSIRSFYADQPLQIWITDEGKMGVKFYSPIPIKNVKVSGYFGKITPEHVEIAVLEEVKPFMECYFTLPITEHDCVFTGTSGRKVKIPAMPNLKPADLAINFECDDPFMQKIATINSHWYIRFSAYSADAGHAYWRHMDPLLCRHGVALALNMAFMFSSPEFDEELQNYDGILYDNGGNAINLDNLRKNIRNHGGLCLGRVVGVGGLGGGQTYGLADYCYTGVYHNNTPVGSNPHNYPRQAMFHEYGHCLGYGHSSNMTYGDCWTVICAKVFVEMGRAGKLPVSDITDVTDLPME